MTIDRTPRACEHLHAQHQHGTRAAYKLDCCRCVPCRDANTAYERHRRRQQVYGRWQPYVCAASARAHVLQLMREGLGLKRVAALSGVPTGSLAKLIYGQGGRRRSARIRVETRDRLLLVHADLSSLGSTISVDGFGTRRRLQALVAAGWSQSKLARRVGVEPTNFGRVITAELVQVKTARAVIALYDELAETRPPEATHRDKIAASRARNYAKARGWLPPAWWDDDQLDAVDVTGPAVEVVDVDEIAVERALGGQRVTLTSGERDEVVRRLVAGGAGVTEIARVLHANGQTARSLLAAELAASA